MKLKEKRIIYVLVLMVVAIVLRFSSKYFLGEDYVNWFRMIAFLITIGIGVVVLNGVAKIIEETTGVLSERTKIAGGLLQALGTAMPDMILGVVAAIMSLSVINEDYARGVNFAIIAAATTFGSNIYNIAHAAWCVFRQNLANKLSQSVLMFPKCSRLGTLKPMNEHKVIPSMNEIDTSIDVSVALTILTAIVAMSMVIFGRVESVPGGMEGDLYKLIKPIGLLVFVACMFILYIFRKSEKTKAVTEEIILEEEYYKKRTTWFIILNLFISGVAILLTAEAMVGAIEVFCEITHLPFVIGGVLTGIIGCLGEMIVVHNFSINPNGRIGDAIVGVAMDNIVTISGASIIAIMGGIFLGGNALILIFVIILTLNSLLIWQISRLKNYFIK